MNLLLSLHLVTIQKFISVIAQEQVGVKLPIQCYICHHDEEDHLCQPGILGEKVTCKPEVTHCIKTWTGKSLLIITWISRSRTLSLFLD